MIRPVHLPRGAESLTWRAPDDEIDSVRSDKRLHLGGCEFREVFLQYVWHVSQVFPENVDRLRIEIDRSETFEPGALESQRESAAAAEEVEKSGRVPAHGKRRFLVRTQSR